MTCKRIVKEKVFAFISYYIIFLITPRSLVPKFSRSPITRSPIPCSPIACSGTLTPRSLPSPDCLLPNHSLANTHPVPVFFCPSCSLTARSFPPTLFWSNFLPDCSLPTTHPVPGLLISHISFPDRLLSTITCSLTPTQSLIFCFRPWYSTSETKSDFRKYSLHTYCNFWISVPPISSSF